MDQELVQYLEERLDRQEQRFNARLDEWIEEVKRHTGVLVEGLRYEIQLVAEGFAVFVEGRYAQDQAKIDRQFQETHALIRSSYEHLQQQQDQTRQRVENLERKSEN